MTLAIPNVEMLPVTFDDSAKHIVVPESYAKWVRIAYRVGKQKDVRNPILEPELFEDGSAAIEFEHLTTALSGLYHLWHELNQSGSEHAQTLYNLGHTIGSVALEQIIINGSEGESTAALQLQLLYAYPLTQQVPVPRNVYNA